MAAALAKYDEAQTLESTHCLSTRDMRQLRHVGR
jgi:hypothetical protein